MKISSKHTLASILLMTMLLTGSCSGGSQTETNDGTGGTSAGIPRSTKRSHRTIYAS